MSQTPRQAREAADAEYWAERLNDPDVLGEVEDVEVAKPLTATFSLRIPSDELNAIRDAAAQQGVSVSEWVRGVCAAALRAVHAPPLMRRQMEGRLVELHKRLQEETHEVEQLSRWLADA